MRLFLLFLFSTLGGGRLGHGGNEPHSEFVEGTFDELFFAFVEVALGFLLEDLEEIDEMLGGFEILSLLTGDGIFYCAEADKSIGDNAADEHI